MTDSPSAILAPGPAAFAGATTRFVLVQPGRPGNVGAAARAMKVMGFTDLVLVDPPDPAVAAHPEARARASGATDLLDAARCVPTLAAALAGCGHACATAMTPRDFGPPTAAPRGHFAALAAAGWGEGPAQRLALVFGPERTGLANDDVYLCHAVLSVPTAPGYGSLNLAQAVQVLAYEWRQALGGFAVQPRTRARARAPHDAVEGLLAHWQRTLAEIGFLDPDVPRRLLPRLRRLLHRAAPTEEEVHILHGIARAAAAPRRRR